MTADNIKTLFTYLAALTVIVGGFVLIYLMRTDPDASEIRLMIAGFIGIALQFLFSERVATTAANNAQPTFISAEPPSTINVTGGVEEAKPEGLG